MTAIETPAPQANGLPAIRDRIKRLDRVKAGDLVKNPKNWRTHPKSQQEALRGVLAEVGYSAALIARELPDGRLMLIDGHLRQETTPDEIVPVLVLDVDDAEADKLLATMDRIAAMAKSDNKLLQELQFVLTSDNEALKKLFKSQTPGDVMAKLPIPGNATRNIAEHGQVWRLGERHRMIVADVFTEWPKYVAYLIPGSLLIPYGGPLIALSAVAKEKPLVIIQPVPYVAGVVLDWYEDAHGPDSIGKL